MGQGLSSEHRVRRNGIKKSTVVSIFRTLIHRKFTVDGRLKMGKIFRIDTGFGSTYRHWSAVNIFNSAVDLRPYIIISCSWTHAIVSLLLYVVVVHLLLLSQ